jgi:fructose-specific phosphotransferase system IIC component
MEILMPLLASGAMLLGTILFARELRKQKQTTIHMGRFMVTILAIVMCATACIYAILLFAAAVRLN